jgi:hypothetical protein
MALKNLNNEDFKAAIGNSGSTHPTINVEGATYFNTEVGAYYTWDGSEWRAASVQKTESKVEPKNLLVYYGWPISYKNLNDTTLVINDIAAHYDIYIVGDGYQDSTHSSYTDTQTIINGLRSKGVEIYGYTPIGVSPGANRTITELKTQIDDWETLNVDGHFLDEFGFDYGVDRDRQVELVNYIHGKGSKYTANSWVFQDFAADSTSDLPTSAVSSAWATDGSGWKYEQWTDGNPNNTALPRNADDVWMKENFVCDDTGLNNKWALGELFTTEILPFNTNNYPIWALAVFGKTSSGSGIVDWDLYPTFDNMEEMAPFIWANAIVYKCYAAGGGGYSFGSNGNVVEVNKYKLPQAFIEADFTSSDPVWSSSNGVSISALNTKYQLEVQVEETSDKYNWKLTSPQEFILTTEPKIKKYDFTASASQTDFTVNNQIFTEARVYTNGIREKDSTYTISTSSSNTTVSFDSGKNSGDWIMIEV